ncbi:hypothetical protein JXX19_01215 [Ruthenibacterium lactatiformans]|nr:hypothetical protein [Ruthenibacterium lactatiformans]MBN3025038.1 hypothetical protein [Ruthenibacterium lactatiformans]
MSRRRRNEWENSDYEGIFEGLSSARVEAPPLEPPPPNRKNSHILPGWQYLDSTDFLKKRACRLVQLTEDLPQNQPLENIPDKKLYTLLEQITQADMAVRNAILGALDSKRPERRKRYVERLNIHVSQPKNCILRLTLPPLASAKFAGSYDIYQNTKLALEEYFSTRNVPDLTGQKLTLIYKRVVKNIRSNAVCDNDNWEMKRVTNAITETLFYSDNAAHFSFFYTTVEGPIAGTEATVIRETNLMDFTGYLTEPGLQIGLDS